MILNKYLVTTKNNDNDAPDYFWTYVIKKNKKRGLSLILIYGIFDILFYYDLDQML